jgi:L-lysine 2,3-aminomutase
VEYLRSHPEVTDVLITGGDPMVARAHILERTIEPLLSPELGHVRNIRIGTKSVAYWPQRFVTDDDADDLLRLFERVTQAGRQLAIMAHYSHPRELSTWIAVEAVRRLRAAGCQIRTQSPLLRHINDSPEMWGRLWGKQVRLGMIPYYMFVERATGAKDYFSVPLVRAWQIYREALQTVSGLGRTVRGPSMSCLPGKILVDGVTEVLGWKVFALQFIQGRDPDWVNRSFFASYDPQATWFSELRPAFGERCFFFEEELEHLIEQRDEKSPVLAS